MMGVRGRAVLVLRRLLLRIPRLRLGRRLPVKKRLLEIHAQLGHLIESLGSDKELPMAVRLLFLDPLHFHGGFDKDIADSKRVDWSETILVFNFGFHLTPLMNSGKKFTLRCMRSGRLEYTADAG